VRENIAFGKSGATDAEVKAAADGASISADIEGFPEQYRTVVRRTRDHFFPAAKNSARPSPAPSSAIPAS